MLFGFSLNCLTKSGSLAWHRSALLLRSSALQHVLPHAVPTQPQHPGLAQQHNERNSPAAWDGAHSTRPLHRAAVDRKQQYLQVHWASWVSISSVYELRAWSPDISVVSVLGREKGCQAAKVFITSDLCENRYLCFLVESQQQLRWMCGLYFFKFNFYINSIDHFAFLVFNYFKALALSCISFVCCLQVC